MNTLALLVVATTGIFLVGEAAILTTHNAKSAIIFKVAPAILGVGCIWAATVLWWAQ